MKIVKWHLKKNRGNILTHNVTIIKNEQYDSITKSYMLKYTVMSTVLPRTMSHWGINAGGSSVITV